ncbi:uncharacterized protein EDB93DRAFT_1107253 [Suillus bovinus]|uniref:uncharacterized protein n=1 Tax=Suillus bovinus TaxID=48563 RepID=UPI001B863949|nr:uncharacterized protein EDB93DRAFT_1107253 [Suillus bovinus]KAG2134929.1 hypothetical protein EDB93DRAFT_1107253 [Suillus bovinus]
MTPIPLAAPSSQMDTLVSVRLDGLIGILQGLALNDRKAISDTLLASIGQADAKEPVANVMDASITNVSVPAPDTPSPSISTAPSPTATAVPAFTPIVIPVDSGEGKDSSNGEDVDVSLTNGSTLCYHHGKYFNVPIEAKAPLYYITRGRYIGVFSGWDATSPKVLGVSRAIYHKVESVEQGAGIVKCAIERGEAAQLSKLSFKVIIFVRVLRSPIKEFWFKQMYLNITISLRQWVSLGRAMCYGLTILTHCFGPNKYRVQAARDKCKQHYLNGTLHDCIAAVKHAKGDFMAYVKAPRRFFDFLVDEYSKTMPDPKLYPTRQGDKSVFEHAIENFENFIDRANSRLDGILQMCGICEEWRAADAVCKFMREIVGIVEDILLHLADGRDGELVIAFMEGHPMRHDKSEKGNYNNFWPPFFKKWEENWPITLEDSSEPLDENTRLEQIAKARDALQTVIFVS